MESDPWTSTSRRQQAHGRRSAALAALLCASVVAAYLACVLPRLSLPGLQTEEALTVLPAFDSTRAKRFGPLSFAPSLVGYHGSLESYLAVPFVWALGRNVRAVRAAAVSFGAAALVAVFLGCWVAFGELRTAWLASFLLGTLPCFVSGSYFGMDHASAVICFQAWSLLCLAAYLKSGRPGILNAAAVFAGAATACRLWAPAGLVSFGAAVLAVSWPQLRAGLRSGRLKPSPRAAVRLFLLFCLGAFPLNVHIVSDSREFYSRLTDRVQGDASPKAPDTLGALSRRVEQLRWFSSHDPHLAGVFNRAGVSESRPWRGRLMVAAAAWLLFSAAFAARGFTAAQRLVWPLWVLFYLLLLGALPIERAHPSHLWPVVVPLSIMIAVAVADLGNRLDGGRSAVRAVLALAAAVVIRWPDRPALQSYLAEMPRINPHYSPVVDEVASWLQSRPPVKTVVDHGLNQPLAFITGREDLLRIGDGLEEQKGWDWLPTVRLFVGYAPELAVNAHLGVRLRHEKLGPAARPIREFRDKSGTRVIAFELPDGLPKNPGLFLAPKARQSQSLE